MFEPNFEEADGLGTCIQYPTHPNRWAAEDIFEGQGMKHEIR